MQKPTRSMCLVTGINNLFNRSVTVSMSIAELPPESIQALLGPVEEQKYELVFKRQVQSKCHRKKRINKKWLKRYGYRNVEVHISEASVSTTESIEGGPVTWTFKGNSIKQKQR